MRELRNPCLDRTSARIVKIALEINGQEYVLNNILGCRLIAENLPCDREYQPPVARKKKLKTIIATSLQRSNERSIVDGLGMSMASRNGLTVMDTYQHNATPDQTPAMAF